MMIRTHRYAAGTARSLIHHSHACARISSALVPSVADRLLASPSCVATQQPSASLTTTTPHGPSANRSRIGIGGAKLSRSGDLNKYATVIATALRSGVSTFESGHGGESNLSHAYQAAEAHLRQEDPEELDKVHSVTLTARFGYRTVGGAKDTEADGSGEDYVGKYPHDLQAEEGQKSSEDESSDNKLASSELDEQSDEPSEESSTAAEEDEKNLTSATSLSQKSGIAVHNLSREYVAKCLSSSPLVRVRNEQRLSQDGGRPDINLVYMAHNPEAQGAVLAGRGAPLEEIRGIVRERLTDAFVGLELGKAEGNISSYGVCSNGLSLPEYHPLHLSWMDVLSAASSAVNHVHGCDSQDGLAPSDIVASLSTLQLPCNLLETSALKVSEDVKTYLDTDDGDDGDETPPRLPNLPSMVDIYVTRPLTCYPDQGTGSGHPFKLVDYLIDSTMGADLTSGSTKVWTNTIEGSRPPHYGPALAATMGHFDATEILEAGEERKLTVEERESLEGCRLLQSMIHDLDANLDDIRSFAAYEEDLFAKVVPLISDTFEELDEDSAAVLQGFFVAHGNAVRHAIARTTRRLLREGGDGVEPYDVPDNVTLQEFALQYLLRQRQIDRVIVGCPEPTHVLEALRAADHL